LASVSARGTAAGKLDDDDEAGRAIAAIGDSRRIMSMSATAAAATATRIPAGVKSYTCSSTAQWSRPAIAGESCESPPAQGISESAKSARSASNGNIPGSGRCACSCNRLRSHIGVSAAATTIGYAEATETCCTAGIAGGECSGTSSADRYNLRTADCCSAQNFS
jgi:hypothetical protein